ncbi:MAG: hypothetical protein ACYS30_15810 [Planctomycetota bacterium]|jgi:hypothetical protein
MINEDTVFILGAGASCPYGFPDGKKLRYEIFDRFERDFNTYFNQHKNLHNKIDPLVFDAKGFSEAFKDSGNKSIDLFLSRNRKFMEKGKWAIIFRILIHEKNSTFIELTKEKDKDWYSYLFEKLSEDLVSKEDYIHLFDKKIYFITFNYDRSLEYFLHKCYFKSFLEIDDDKKQEHIKKLKVIHIFGKVSGLEWQDDEIKYIYRIEPFSVDVEKIAKDMKIIYEETEEKKFGKKDLENKDISNLEEKNELENKGNPKIEEAKDLIKKAKRTFFLGFGYAPENLKLLDIPNILNRNQKIYGTGYGLYPEEIKKRIKSITPPVRPTEISDNRNIHIEDCDCLKLLRKYL